jgi:hypothetical protein
LDRKLLYEIGKSSRATKNQRQKAIVNGGEDVAAQRAATILLEKKEATTINPKTAVRLFLILMNIPGARLYLFNF